MRKIAIVHTTPFPEHQGGIEHWLKEILLKNINDNENEIIVISPKSKDMPYYIVNESTIVKIPCREIKGSKKICRYFNTILFWNDFNRKVTKNIINDNEIKIIIIIHIIPCAYICKKLKRKGIHCIALLRNTLGLDLIKSNRGVLGRIYILFEKYLAHYVDKIIGNGEDAKKYIELILKRKGDFIPNGVDFLKFSSFTLDDIQKNKEKKKLGLSNDTNIIANVGTLIEIKGIDYLLDALVDLRNEKIVLLLLGKGNIEHYKQKAKNLCIEDKVIFLGRIEDIRPYIYISDIVTVVSGGIGIGHAALEMMAMKKAIVGWNSKVYRQFLKDDYSASLVNEHDSHALATAIKHVITNTEYSKRISQNAQMEALQYDWDKIYSKFVDKLSEYY